MALLKYKTAGAGVKSGYVVQSAVPSTWRTLRVLPAVRAVALLLVFAGSLSRAKGESMIVGPDPNQPSALSPDGRYVVTAQTAALNAIALPLGYPGVPQIIQKCMNAQLQASGQQANWPLPVFGGANDPFPDITFILNTPDHPYNYGAVAWSDTKAGALLIMTAQNLPPGEHWLQLVHASYLASNETANNVWPDPNGNGYWSVDNNVTPGQPFYDVAAGINMPSFIDGPGGPWDGTSFFHAYLFAADIDPNTNVITLHDFVAWGWNEPLADPTIPEPSTLALFGMSVLAVLYLYARQRKPVSGRGHEG